MTTTIQPNFQDLYHIRDIAQLQPFNYVLNEKKSSSGWSVLKGPDGNKILVKNTEHPGDSFFINDNDSNDKGKLLKFVASRISNSSTRNLTDQDIKNAISFLHKINGTSISNGLDAARIKSNERKAKKNDLKKAYDKEMNTIPLKDTKFLSTERGLSIDIINDPKFKRTLLNTVVQLKNQHTFYNTAFASLKTFKQLPHEAPLDSDIQGLEIRNKDFKIRGGNWFF